MLPYLLNVDGKKFFVKRKKIRLLNDCIEKIHLSSFTEIDIHTLLTEIREFIRDDISIKRQYHRNNPSESYQLHSLLMDICDCIAHSNKTREALHQSIGTMMELFSQRNEFPKESVVHVDEITAMLCAILSSLADYLDEVTRINVSIFEREKDDIAICILSLLQDTVFVGRDSKGNEWQVVLSMRTVNGEYGLYGVVYSLPYPLHLPLFVQTKKSNFIFNEDFNKAPDILETFRDSVNGTLGLCKSKIQ